MSRLAARLATAAVVLGGAAVSLAVGAALLTAWSPVVREHCITPRSDHIESGWKIALWPPVLASTDTVTRERFCIRNSPVREGLSAAGVWKLGSPEEQFARALAAAND